MRNMSFALTREPMLRQQKHVTRRMGWLFLKIGDYVQPVLKAMGLKMGEGVVKIGGPIQIVHLRRERLARMTEDPAYGRAECDLEGFPEMSPAEFVAMFCRTHANCTPQTVVTRISFEFCPVPTTTATR